MRTSLRRFTLLILGLLPAMAQQSFGPVAGPTISDFSPSPALYSRTPQLFRSTDDGANWTAVPLLPLGSQQPAINALTADRWNAQVLYAALSAADGGLLKSTDRGLTWKAAINGLPAAADVTALRVSNNGDLYARAGDSIYRTRDGAASWQLMGTLPGATFYWDITRANGANQYIAGNQLLYRSRDGGATWSQVAAPVLHPHNTFQCLAADANDPDRLYMGERGPAMWDENYDYAGVHRSTDGGASWKNVEPETEPSTLVTDPSGRPSVYRVTVESGDLCQSLNSGDTWQCNRVAPGIEPLRSIWILPSNPAVIYALTSANLYVSHDTGYTWTAVTGSYKPTLLTDRLAVSLNPGGTAAISFAAQTVETRAQPIPFTVSTSGESWLSVSPISGKTPATLTVALRATGLALGTHNATIRIAAPDTANLEVAVPVSATVSALPPGVPQYRITTFAGTGSGGNPVNGLASQSPVTEPGCLTMDGAGNLWAVLGNPESVVRISAGGTLRWMAGTPTGFSGDGHDAFQTKLSPECAAADGDMYYISEPFWYRMRAVDSTGMVSTFLTFQKYVTRPTGLAVGNNHTLYFTDGSGQIMATGPTGNTSVVAGGGFGGDGAALSVALHWPYGITLDSAGNLYFTEWTGNRVRKYDAARRTVTTVAGTGTAGYSGDGGKATAAQLNTPESVAVDKDGNLFIADTNNNVIRFVNSKDGNIYTIAGTGVAGYNGDDQAATQAQIRYPKGIAVDRNGVVFVSDLGHRIRRLDPMASNTPWISSVMNGAGYQAEIAPGSWLVVTGSNLAGNTRTWRDSEIADGVLPRELDGVRVTVSGKDAVIYFISPGQINALAPDTLANGNATVEVSNNGTHSLPVTVTVQQVSPAFFLVAGYAAARHYPDYKIASRPDLFAGCTDALNCPVREVAPGELLLLYGTGFGPIGSDGMMTLPVRVRFGNTWVDAAGGLSSAGLYQIAATVPADAATGDVEVIAEIGGRQSPVSKVPVRR